MRILIGNHIDPAIQTRKDMRSWTQRIYWFAQEGDLIVLPASPDKKFLEYVTGMTGVDCDSIKIHVPPYGEHGDHLLEKARVLDEEFLKSVASDCSDVTEVFSLWPSAWIADFAEALGLVDKLPGAAFLSQGGGELVNNKAYYRVLAAVAGVPFAAGGVAHSSAEAADLTAGILRKAGAVMVKQAHNGAGGGNQLVVSDRRIETGHAGAKHIYYLDDSSERVQDYWDERWDWASAGGRHPVVLEAFHPKAATVFCEYLLTDEGLAPTETGSLGYVNRWLSEQVLPLRGVREETVGRLVSLGQKLAEIYWSIGYRGYLSADAVLDESENLIFTEVNARVCGTTHVYEPIAHKIVDVWKSPARSVVDYHWPKTEWRPVDLEEFLELCERLGCGFDPDERTGVIVTTPFDGLRGLSFSIAFGSEEAKDDILQRLDGELRLPREEQQGN